MKRILTVLLGLLLIPGTAGAQVEGGDSMSWDEYDTRAPVRTFRTLSRRVRNSGIAFLDDSSSSSWMAPIA